MSDTITVASPPSTAEFAATGLAYMAAQSGVVTDLNKGSQIRTLMEAAGSIVEETSITAEALAFQAILYSAFAAFLIEPILNTQSNGSVLFATGTGGSPPVAAQNVAISEGTVVQSVSGVQFETTETVVLLAGTTSISAPISALLAGTAGNAAANTITIIASGLPYPLVVNNTAPTTGGLDAETPAQTLARFTAKVLGLGEASPVSIANACIGVSVVGTGETVYYATVYEPWADSTSGITTAQFRVYIDNGSGSASSQLISAVSTVLNGSFAANESGFRPAGVPYQVLAVVPDNFSVTVTATLINSALAASLNQAVSLAVQAYANTLNYNVPAESSQIDAAVANALAGQITSLSISMLDSTGTPQTVILPSAPGERMILTAVVPTLS